jgi:hypothetical protein
MLSTENSIWLAHLVILDDRNHNLGSAVRVTGDMPGKLIDVGNQLRKPSSCSGAAHSFPYRNDLTGNVALEGPKDQLPCIRWVNHVETAPVGSV